MRRSTDALTGLETALRRFRDEGVVFHAIRTRQAGRRSFVSMHVLVPGRWTVQRGHELLESVEAAVRVGLPHSTVFTHLEPVEDSASFDDTTLDRAPWDDAAPPAVPASADGGPAARSS